MKIGDVEINGKAILAPLAGYTDSNFRILCRKMGAALVITEMVSADGIVRGNTNSLRYLFYDKREVPIAIQIFGESPDIMTEAAKLVGKFNPNILDINFGCPSKKVVKRGAGSAILKDLKKMENIARGVTKNSPVPVTAKIRSGWSKESIIAVEAAVILEDCGIKAISIHPRTSKTPYSEPSDWTIIRDVKKSVNVPVIGNGDINNAVDAKKMFDETGCDFVMVGRASTGNPWIFRDINCYLNEGIIPPEPSFDEIFEICMEHISSAIKNNGEFYAVNYLKKHIRSYFKGISGNHKLINEIIRMHSAKDMKQKIISFFDKQNYLM